VLLLLQEQTISDKFASLSEALQVAESKAREATEMRKHVALEMARRQKQAKDEQLRKLAQQARMERGGPLAAAAAGAGGGGGLASRLDAGGAAAAAAAAGEMPRYPGPPGGGGGGGGGGYRGDDSPGSSEDEERRRGSRRREEGGRVRERDEYQETAQVRAAGAMGGKVCIGCGMTMPPARSG
jgi:SNW domain-containing protein 1